MSSNMLAQPKDSQALLLRSIAEHLKMPLMYMARQAELGQQEAADSIRSLNIIEGHADMALRLVDSYLLSLDLTSKQLSLELEPVPIAATLYDVAHDLTPVARQRNTDIELVLAGKYGQVMAHPAGLKAALYDLGLVLSEVIPQGKIRNTLRIAAHRTRGGIAAGLYVEGLENLQAAVGYSKLAQTTFLRQPFPGLTVNTGAGVFVAETIFEAMHSRLRPGRFQSQQGLAATLQPNRQLQLI